MTNEERKSALEAIIYAADEPATVEQLAAALGEEKMVVQASLDELVASYAVEERGVEIRAVAGGYKMYTKPQQHDVVRKFIKSLRPPLRLTMPALETLAVIAYKQPVTGPEISEIRGVNTSGVITTLLDKRLITTAGRKEVMGRPILYKTSKEFLMRFGLSDLTELPSLKEFEALAREALGSDEGIVQEVAEGSPEVAVSESQAAGSESSEAAAQTGEQAQEQGQVEELAKSEGGEGIAIEQVEGEITQVAPAENNSASVEDNAEGTETETQELIAEETAATNEGMPAGELDEAPKQIDEVQSTESMASGEEIAGGKHPQEEIPAEETSAVSNDVGTLVDDSDSDKSSKAASTGE